MNTSKQYGTSLVLYLEGNEEKPMSETVRDEADLSIWVLRNNLLYKNWGFRSSVVL
jgi:hypothetical protein